MELKIVRVDARGSASSEYLIIKVLQDCNLKQFMICDKTFNSDGSPSNKHRHVYFFPSCEVREGEYVWLNTCPGKDCKNRANGGQRAHEFFWGLNSSVWNDGGDKAHLIKIAEIETLDVPPIA
ncbi:hypothetical protein [Pseudomonas mosselii]|uniref:hypothetical protein n=1 Tax=Pseudomonas mosselii TaxID=78327 RepID=UPI0012FD7758|nr:hypothetical protein [Pseudomonas mosselii]